MQWAKRNSKIMMYCKQTHHYAYLKSDIGKLYSAKITYMKVRIQFVITLGYKNRHKSVEDLKSSIKTARADSCESLNLNGALKSMLISQNSKL